MALIASMSSYQIRNTVTSVVRRLRFSTNAGNTSKLGPLPSSPSPTKAKARYLESKNVTDKYLDPHEKILQLNKEIELVRERAADKLEQELKKSVWRKLSDPLVKHKHSLYNVFAMTLAYVLAHNLFVTSKREKEARNELSQSHQENDNMKRILKSVLEESTITEIGTACAEEFNNELRLRRSVNASRWWPWIGSTMTQDELKQKALEELFRDVVKKELESRLGDAIASEEDRKRLSIEEIMQQNEENVRTLNENPELLLQLALESAEEADGTDGKKQRKLFSM